MKNIINAAKNILFDFIKPFFNNFHDLTLEIIVISQKEARILKDIDMKPYHFLLGFFQIDSKYASKYLKHFNFNYEILYKSVIEHKHRSKWYKIPMIELPYSSGAKIVLKQAKFLAEKLNDDFVLPGHLLIAILENDEISKQIFKNLDIDVKKMIDYTYQLLKEEPKES